MAKNLSNKALISAIVGLVSISTISVTTLIPKLNEKEFNISHNGFEITNEEGSSVFYNKSTDQFSYTINNDTILYQDDLVYEEYDNNFILSEVSYKNEYKDFILDIMFKLDSDNVEGKIFSAFFNEELYDFEINEVTDEELLIDLTVNNDTQIISLKNIEKTFNINTNENIDPELDSGNNAEGENPDENGQPDTENPDGDGQEDTENPDGNGHEDTENPDENGQPEGENPDGNGGNEGEDSDGSDKEEGENPDGNGGNEGEDSNSNDEEEENPESEVIPFIFSINGWLLVKEGSSNEYIYQSINDGEIIYVIQIDDTYHYYLYDGRNVYYTSQSILSFNYLTFKNFKDSLLTEELEKQYKDFFVDLKIELTFIKDSLNDSIEETFVYENTLFNVITNDEEISLTNNDSTWTISNITYNYTVESFTGDLDWILTFDFSREGYLFEQVNGNTVIKSYYYNKSTGELLYTTYSNGLYEHTLYAKGVVYYATSTVYNLEDTLLLDFKTAGLTEDMESTYTYKVYSLFSLLSAVETKVANKETQFYFDSSNYIIENNLVDLLEGTSDTNTFRIVNVNLSLNYSETTKPNWDTFEMADSFLFFHREYDYYYYYYDTVTQNIIYADLKNWDTYGLVYYLYDGENVYAAISDDETFSNLEFGSVTEKVDSMNAVVYNDLLLNFSITKEYLINLQYNLIQDSNPSYITFGNYRCSVSNVTTNQISGNYFNLKNFTVSYELEEYTQELEFNEYFHMKSSGFMIVEQSSYVNNYYYHSIYTNITLFAYESYGYYTQFIYNGKSVYISTFSQEFGNATFTTFSSAGYSEVAYNLMLEEMKQIRLELLRIRSEVNNANVDVINYSFYNSVNDSATVTTNTIYKLNASGSETFLSILNNELNYISLSGENNWDERYVISNEFILTFENRYYYYNRTLGYYIIADQINTGYEYTLYDGVNVYKYISDSFEFSLENAVFTDITNPMFDIDEYEGEILLQEMFESFDMFKYAIDMYRYQIVSSITLYTCYAGDHYSLYINTNTSTALSGYVSGNTKNIWNLYNTNQSFIVDKVEGELVWPTNYILRTSGFLLEEKNATTTQYFYLSETNDYTMYVLLEDGIYHHYIYYNTNVFYSSSSDLGFVNFKNFLEANLNKTLEDEYKVFLSLLKIQLIELKRIVNNNTTIINIELPRSLTNSITITESTKETLIGNNDDVLWTFNNIEYSYILEENPNIYWTDVFTFDDEFIVTIANETFYYNSTMNYIAATRGDMYYGYYSTLYDGNNVYVSTSTLSFYNHMTFVDYKTFGFTETLEAEDKAYLISMISVMEKLKNDVNEYHGSSFTFLNETFNIYMNDLYAISAFGTTNALSIGNVEYYIEIETVFGDIDWNPGIVLSENGFMITENNQYGTQYYYYDEASNYVMYATYVDGYYERYAYNGVNVFYSYSYSLSDMFFYTFVEAQLYYDLELEYKIFFMNLVKELKVIKNDINSKPSELNINLGKSSASLLSVTSNSETGLIARGNEANWEVVEIQLNIYLNNYDTLVWPESFEFSGNGFSLFEHTTMYHYNENENMTIYSAMINNVFETFLYDGTNVYVYDSMLFAYVPMSEFGFSELEETYYLLCMKQLKDDLINFKELFNKRYSATNINVTLQFSSINCIISYYSTATTANMTTNTNPIYIVNDEMDYTIVEEVENNFEQFTFSNNGFVLENNYGTGAYYEYYESDTNIYLYIEEIMGNYQSEKYMYVLLKDNALYITFDDLVSFDRLYFQRAEGILKSNFINSLTNFYYNDRINFLKELYSAFNSNNNMNFVTSDNEVYNVTSMSSEEICGELYFTHDNTVRIYWRIFNVSADYTIEEYVSDNFEEFDHNNETILFYMSNDSTQVRIFNYTLNITGIINFEYTVNGQDVIWFYDCYDIFYYPDSNFENIDYNSLVKYSVYDANYYEILDLLIDSQSLSNEILQCLSSFWVKPTFNFYSMYEETYYFITQSSRADMLNGIYTYGETSGMFEISML